MDMTSKAFRQAHLLKLIEQYGTIEALAPVIGLGPQYISQLKNGTRGIGDKTARKIEVALGWPEGALDRPPPGENVNDELIYLFRNADEDAAINAVSEALPNMSEEGIRRLTAALLSRLNTPSDD